VTLHSQLLQNGGRAYIIVRASVKELFFFYSCLDKIIAFFLYSPVILAGKGRFFSDCVMRIS